MSQMHQAFDTFVKVSLLTLAILSLLLGVLDLGCLIVPFFIHDGQFTWNVELFFSTSALAFGLMNLVVWKGIHRYSLGNILAITALVTILALVLVLLSGFSPKEGEYTIAPENMPASCIRPVSTNQIPLWFGKHYGIPIDFLHIYTQSGGNGLYVGFDPQWLFVDWVMAFVPFYALAFFVLEIKWRKRIRLVN